MKAVKNILSGIELLPLITEAALDKKAEDVVVLDLERDTWIADYFLVCSADNQNHTRAIRDSIVDDLQKRGITPWHSEGEQDGQWILIDYSDVVVHIMTTQVRQYYAIEELWKPFDKHAPKGRTHA
jgi:ribosome-associated protein